MKTFLKILQTLHLTKKMNEKNPFPRYNQEKETQPKVQVQLGGGQPNTTPKVQLGQGQTQQNNQGQTQQNNQGQVQLEDSQQNTPPTPKVQVQLGGGQGQQTTTPKVQVQLQPRAKPQNPFNEEDNTPIVELEDEPGKKKKKR